MWDCTRGSEDDPHATRKFLQENSNNGKAWILFWMYVNMLFQWKQKNHPSHFDCNYIGWAVLTYRAKYTKKHNLA